MAWRHVEDVITVVPQYATKQVAVAKTNPFTGERYTQFNLGLSKTPTGTTTQVTHSFWRCGICAALACGPQGEKPSGDCGKCKARG